MTPTFKEVASLSADVAHAILMASSDEALDGDQTEELTRLFGECLNTLNGNK